MRWTGHCILAVALLALFASLATASEPEIIPAVQGGPAEMYPSEPRQAPAPRPLSPMMEEIQALVESERGRLALLHEALAEAQNAATMMALHQEIAELHESTELDILGVQLRYARQRGDAELVQELEQGIAQLSAAPVEVRKVDRSRSDESPSGGSQ